MDTETSTIIKDKSVMLGKHHVCHIRAKRDRNGVHVTITGGADVASIVKRLAEMEGRRPQTLHGLRLYSEVRALDYLASSMKVPTVPQLGAWVLKSADLGNPEGFTFTLGHVHGKDFLISTVNTVGSVARAIYYEYCKALTVEKDVTVP